jgi:hypothetical protein
MNVDLVSALAAGLLGGVLMLLLQIGVSTAGRRQFDLLGMWTSLLAVHGVRVIGVIVHLAVSVAVAVLYALGFAMAGASDYGWAWGLTGAIIHWIIAGSFLGGIPDNDDRRSPGPFATRLGPEIAVGFFIAHLAFGVVVGMTYFALHPAGGFESAI